MLSLPTSRVLVKLPSMSHLCVALCSHLTVQRYYFFLTYANFFAKKCQKNAKYTYNVRGKVRETGAGRGKMMPRALGCSGVSRGGSLRVRGLSLVLLLLQWGAHPHRPQRRAPQQEEQDTRKQPPQRKDESQNLYFKYISTVVIRGLSLVLLYRHDGAHPNRPQRRANKPREEEPRKQPPQGNKTPRTY